MLVQAAWTWTVPVFASLAVVATGFQAASLPRHIIPATFAVPRKPLLFVHSIAALDAVTREKTMSVAHHQAQPPPRVQWIIRPATVHDRDGCAALIQRSFQTLLASDYSNDCLEKCLPIITTPRNELLTCGSWYVAEHPSTRQIVACGGWTVRRPRKGSESDGDSSSSGTDNKNRTTTAQSSGLSTSPPPPPPAISVSSWNTTQSEEAIALVPNLRHFAVHPDYLRMGIASSIWRHSEKEIQLQFESENRPFPTLEVFSTLTAESFYTSLGFVHVRRVDFNFSNDAIFPSILMRRAPHC